MCEPTITNIGRSTISAALAAILSGAVAVAVAACDSTPPPNSGTLKQEKVAVEKQANAPVRETTPMPPAEPAGLPAPADVAAAPSDATRTASGLASKVLQAAPPSKSAAGRPGGRDRVTVHYTGWTTDGKMFDSSVTRGQPASFPLDGVIAGWTEGLQLMTPGEKRRFWIPVGLAYQGRPGAPAGTLVFDVELISFEKAPEPPTTPTDVAAAPRTATKTASGLASRVIRRGTGTRHPAATSTVQVHYSGWTTDGNMFDSSVMRGEAATFPLNGVIAGWTEGVQLMVEGERRRFWIPESLAYQGRPGAPAGMLVFDVELIRILN